MLVSLRRRLFAPGLAARFRRHQKGVAAIEFAGILPLMLLMYIGTVEVGQAVAVNRRVTLVSRTLSDLVAQTTTMNTTDMNNVFVAANTVLYPFSTSNAKMVVTSVKRIGANDFRVVWSRASGTGAVARTANTNVTLPTNLLVNNGDTVIMSEVAYNYTTVTQFFFKTGFTLNEITYMTPRQVTEIPFT